jgi:hypothetical protein
MQNKHTQSTFRLTLGLASWPLFIIVSPAGQLALLRRSAFMWMDLIVVPYSDTVINTVYLHWYCFIMLNHPPSTRKISGHCSDRPTQSSSSFDKKARRWHGKATEFGKRSVEWYRRASLGIIVQFCTEGTKLTPNEATLYRTHHSDLQCLGGELYAIIGQFVWRS